MDGKWIGFILAGGLLNGFAMLISSVAYTAWSIRTRHRGYYFLFRREINLRKAEDAEELAEGVVKWLRPLCIVAANAFWVYLAVLTARMP